MPKKHTLTYNSNLYPELTLLTRDVTCSKLERYGENIDDKKLSVKHTLRN